MELLAPGTSEDLAERVSEAFTDRFGRAPQVVGRAPGRVNLIGEHTDYNRGLCLPVALPHATYAACAPRADGRVRVVSRQADTEWAGGLGEAGPGGVTGWPAYAAGVLWALAEDGFEVPGFDVLVDSTVPVGAGLSSSAALECAVAVGVLSLLGMEPTVPVLERLVAACMRAETEVAGAPTGGLDQTVSLFAESGHALLLDFHDHSRRQVPMPVEAAGLAILVIETRVSHALVDGGYAARRDDCIRAAGLLGLPSLRAATVEDVARLDDERLHRRARHVVTEIQRVRDTVAALARSDGSPSDWSAVGRLFDASHASLRDDYEVSCAELDLAVETAREAGALGARMTGGGFGGSALALVQTGAVSEVAAAVESAFDRREFRRPHFLLATPSAAAGAC